MANIFIDLLKQNQQQPQYTPNPNLVESALMKQQQAKQAMMSPVAKNAAPATDAEEIAQLEKKTRTAGGPLDIENLYSMLVDQSLNPPESEGERQLREKILEEQKKNIEAQKASIQTQREIAKLALTRQPSTNLSPILNLIDSWTGSNLSQGYQPPKSSEDLTNQAFTMQQKIADLSGELTKSQSEFLKTQLQGLKDRGGYDPLRLARELDRSRASDERRAMAKDRFGQQLVERVEKDKVIDKANQSIAASSNIRQLIEANNPLADNAIPTFLARASGEVGALSEADKRPFGGEQSLVSRMKQAAQMAATGTLTPENREFVRQLAATMENSAKININRRKKDLAANYSRAQRSFTKDEVEALLGIDNMQQETPAEAPTAPGGVLSFEQWQAQQRGR